MAEFDAQGYFNRRQGLVSEAPGKIAELEAAKAKKIQGLKDFQVARDASIAENAGSAVSRLGLDPESTLGTIVNTGAAVVDGIGRVATNLGLAVPAMGVAVTNSRIPNSVREAKARMDAGQATPEDMALLSQPAYENPSTDPEAMVFGATNENAQGNVPTHLEQLRNVEARSNTVNELRGMADTSGLVHKERQQQLAGELKEGAQSGVDQMKKGWGDFRASGNDLLTGTGDMISGLAKALITIPPAALNNPAAAVEFVASNVPQLLMAASGAAGMAASNVPYAIDAYREGIEEYQKAHNGDMPPLEWMQENAAKAASLLVAETVGDKLTLGAGKSLKTITAPASKTLDAAVEKISRETFKKTIQGAGAVVAPVARTAGAIVEGGVGEFGTEAYQTAIEESIKGKEASAEDIFVGGAIGAISGGTASGGIAAGKEGLTAAVKAVTSATSKAGKPPKDEPSTMPESKELETLFTANQLDETAPAVRDTNLAKAQELVAGMEQKITSAKEVASVGAAIKPDELVEMKTTLDVVKQALAAADPADTARVEKMTAAVAQMEATIAAADKKSAPSRKAAIDAQARELKKAQAVLKTMTDQVAAAPQVQEAPGTAGSSETEQETENTPTKVAVRSIVLSMAAVGGLTSEAATAMADDTSLELSDKQRTYLRKFSEARVAENAMKDRSRVLDEMLNGDGGKNISISDYRDRIGGALARGNKQGASRLLGLMKSFAQDHSNKVALAQKLYAKALKDGSSSQMVSDGAGNWSVPATPLNDKDLRQNGGLTISAESKNLVTDIATGSRALNATLAQQEVAYDMTFDGQPDAAAVVEPATAKSVIEKAKATVASVTPKVAKVPETAKAKALAKEKKTESKPVEKPAPAPVVKKAKEENLDDINAELGSIEADAEPDLRGEESSKGPTSGVSPRETPQGGTVEAETETQIVDDTESGILAAFSKENVDAEKEKTSYLEQNLLVRFFKQAAGKANSDQFRPIAAVKDFLSQWTAGKMGDVVPESDALEHFRKQALKWLPTITANLFGKTRQEWAHNDVMQFFLTQLPDGTGQSADMPENVKTAIAMAAYQYVVEKASGTAWNTDKAVNQLIGKPNDNSMFTEEQEELFTAGTGEHLVQNALGKAIMQALGISPKKDAPQNIVSRMESAMGAHAVKLLIDAGLLTVTTFDAAKWTRMTGKPTNSAYEKVHFLKLSRDEDGKPIPQAEAIFKAQQGTQDVLGKLFSVETRNPEPSFEPVPYVQVAPTNTSQSVPAKLADTLKKQNASAYTVKQTSWGAVSRMDEQNVHLMMGVQAIDETTVHIDRERSVMAKNAGLENEYYTFLDYVNEVLAKSANGLKQAMYLSHVAWRNQRVGIDGVINPQTSKFMRSMLTKESWTSTVRLDNEADLQNFMLRVAEAFGVKTENFLAQDAVVKFMEKMDSPEIKAAVAALRKKGDLSKEDQAAIVAGVKAGGENMHSFDGLVALAQFQEASENGEASFDTDLAGEIDGKTNGPMLSFLLLGAATNATELFKRINQGGFYSQDSGVDQYSGWRSQTGNKDLYEGTSSLLRQRLAEDLANMPEMSKAFDPIFFFIGNLINDSAEAVKAGRDLVKKPITALFFGSSLSRGVESMADSFLASIYKSIEKVAKDANSEDPEAQLAVKAKTLEIVRNLKKLVPSWKLPESTPIQDLMNAKIRIPVQLALRQVFIDTMGEAITDTLKSEFGEFMAIRDSINKTGEVAFTVYNAAYQGIREAFIDRLVKEGRIEVDAKGQKLYDLSKEQEAELRLELVNAVPTVDTAMSRGDKDRKAGMLVGKERSRPNNDPTYRGSAKFGTKYEQDNAGQKKGVASTTTIGSGASMEGPGVGTLVSQVHSFDSGISHSAAFLGEVLNIHDAHVTGLKTFTQTAKNLNQATFEQLVEYSPANEILRTLGQTLIGVADMLKDPKVSETVRASLLAGMEKYAKSESTKKKIVTVKGLLEGALNQATETAYWSDMVRLDTLSKLTAVDQYPALGGNYLPTDADRAKAAKMRDALKNETPVELVAAVKVIEEALARKAAPAPEVSLEVTPDVAVVVEPDETSDDSNETSEPLIESQWGVVGKPVVTPEPGVEAIFAKQPTMSATELSRQLYVMLAGQPDSRTRNFNMRLLKAMGRVLSASTMVQLVTPDTTSDQVLEMPAGPSRGWYVDNGKGSVLYVTSSDFTNSGMNTETMIHELVHGALSAAIDDVRAGNGTKEAKELVAELEALLKVTKEFVAADVELASYVKDNFPNALDNIDELVAWGMTNEAFQRDVLERVQMQGKNKKNRLVTGAKAFYQALSQFFFGNVSPRAKEEMASGMEVLLTNVAGLFTATVEAQKGASRNVNLSMAATAASTYNTKDIFHALAASNLTPVSAAFNEHLEGLLDGIVFRLHGTFGSFKESLMQDQVISPADVFQKAKDTGKAPFASASLASGFRISEQEAFAMEQVEVTVQEALDGNIDGNMAYAVRGLKKLYQEAQRTLAAKDFHEGDWATASAQEQAEAQALYDFIFKVEAGGKLSGYLARFAALGLAHEGVNKLLQGKTLDTPLKTAAAGPKSIAMRLAGIFEMILQWFGEKMTRTYKGQPADGKLTVLVAQLVDIEGKRRDMLKTPDTEGVMDMLAEKGKGAVDAVNEKLADFANSPFVQNSPSNLFKAGVTVANMVAQHRTAQLLEAMAAMRDRYSSGQLGVVFGTIKDALGAPELFQTILRATKNLERARKHISTQTSKVMLGSFANQGKDLTERAKQALSNVILRTGAHVLLDHYNEAELHQLLADPVALKKAIKDWEAKLSPYPADVQNYYTNQSRALAYSLVWGEARGPNMMMNAGNIASLYDTDGRQGKVTQAQAREATKTIDVLSTLYALSYSSKGDLKSVAQTLSTEMARTDKQGNGVITVMHGHKALEAEAREKLFGGSEALMVKGYTSEIFNPYTEIVAAEDGSPEAQKLIDDGYTQGSPLKKDSDDPEKKISRLYVRRGGGLSQHVTGTISYTGKEAKGSQVHNGNVSPYSGAGRYNATNLAVMKGKKRAGVAKLFNQVYDPLTDDEKHAAPVMNSLGEAVNYRYMMSRKLKDSLLEREGRFEVLMGAMAASSFDKQTATEQNIVAIKALHDLYKLDYAKHPEAYLEVSPTSPDPELREIYRLLPYETQQAVRRIWGSDKMMVRNDLLDLSFGYRKLGLADLWNKPESARNQMEFALTWFAEHAVEVAARVAGKSPADAKQYAKRTQHIVQKSERVWLDLVKEIKDIIVVKTGTVMLGNILSNLSLLKLNGVSFADIGRYHKTATLGARQWQQDSSELFRLQGELKSGYSTQTPAALERQIRIIENNMAHNPVKVLIDAGLMPSIVEDVSIEDSPYTYKAQLARKVESLTAGLNPTVVSVGRQVYMTRDSVAYKTLSEVTQLSDFVARYTLYMHLINNKSDPMSHTEAVQRASDAFVNYDIPMHRKLQYLDDMGLMMFMKYFIRIQRVIAQLVQDNPTRVAGMLLLDHAIGVPSMILDSSMLTRVGNIPFSSGAAQLPFLFDDLATVKAGISLFK